MRLQISKTARRDLDAIFDYWAIRATPDVAGRLIYSIRDRFHILVDSPDMGRACDEIAAGLRIFPTGKYLIYYRVSRGVLHIVWILHGARDQVRNIRE